MRWVLRRKLETHPELIGPALDRTGEHPIVEISNRDPFWGAAHREAAPDGTVYRGRNALGRLWMELRQHRREEDHARRLGKLAMPHPDRPARRAPDLTPPPRRVLTHGIDTVAHAALHDPERALQQTRTADTAPE